MEEDFIIRRMAECDISTLAEIEREIFPLPWSENAFRNALSDTNAVFMVAADRVKNRSFAYVGMYMAADEGEITNVATAEGERRRGAAYRLLSEMRRISAERHLTQLVLEVRVSNEAAICLYKKAGFEISGVRKGFYQFPPEDAYMMIARL